MKDKETRIYTVPLRKEYLKTPKWRRTKKASSALRAFILKHSKADSVKISRWVNEELWRNGIKNPPSKVKVSVTTTKEKKKKGEKETEKLIAKVELAELPARAKRLEKKEEVKKKKAPKKLAKKEEKKESKSVKDLKKELEELKAKKEEKKKAKLTKTQEMALHK